MNATAQQRESGKIFYVTAHVNKPVGADLLSGLCATLIGRASHLSTVIATEIRVREAQNGVTIEVPLATSYYTIDAAELWKWIGWPLLRAGCYNCEIAGLIFDNVDTHDDHES
jgi:hypothetical protein